MALSKRGHGTGAVLHDGVPGWLRQSLWEWVVDRLKMSGQGGPTVLSKEKLKQIERRLRIELDWRYGVSEALTSLETQVSRNDVLFLDVLDALLDDIYDNPIGNRVGAARKLERALVEGGSAWRVAGRGARLGLERRVDETVTAAARETMATSAIAGEHLSKAWTEAYGRSPDPSSAYGAAVKAVEIAAKPVVLPTDDKATLGKIVPALRDRPEKWHVVLNAPPGFDRVEVVRLMADLLWRGQTDRHGRNARLGAVTQEEAEAAVHLATVLVQWFTAGSVRRLAE